MPGQPAAAEPLAALAVRAWNWMGGQIDWSGLPLVADLLGIEDLEMLITQLATLRDFQRRG